MAAGKARAVAHTLRTQLGRRRRSWPTREMLTGVEGAGAGRLPRPGLLPADPEVTAWRGRGSDRRIHRRRRQARRRDPGASFSKMQKAIADKAFDREIDGIPVLKYEAVLACEVKNPGLGPAAHRVRRQGQRLHLDVHLLRDREVASQGLHGARPDPDLLLDRPPDGPRRRHPEAGRQVRHRAQQDHQGPLSAHRTGAGASRLS